MLTRHGGKREGAGRPRIGEIQLRAKIPADEAASIEEFGEGKGLSEGLRRFIDFSLSAAKELRQGVFARYRPTSNVTFNEFVAPLCKSGLVHNLYGSSPHVLSVKGRLPFSSGQTLWVVAPGMRISAPTALEYERDAETILEALREEGIHCRWIQS